MPQAARPSTKARHAAPLEIPAHRHWTARQCRPSHGVTTPPRDASNALADPAVLAFKLRRHNSEARRASHQWSAGPAALPPALAVPRQDMPAARQAPTMGLQLGPVLLFASILMEPRAHPLPLDILRAIVGRGEPQARITHARR
jgi:hypothetical protein